VVQKSRKAGFEIATHDPSFGFRVFPMRQNPKPVRPAHTHPDVEVNFLLSGMIQYFFAGRFYEIVAGEAAVFWAGIPHCNIKDSKDLYGIWIDLPPQWLLRWKHAGSLAQRLMGSQMIKYRVEKKDTDTFVKWNEDFQKGDPNLREIIAAEMESYFSRISLALEKKPASHMPLAGPLRHVASITDYIGSHYAEKFTVNDLAKVVGLNPKYLLTLFHKSCHLTLWEYVVRLRLGHAQRLLLSTDRTITDIAMEAGFGSLKAFYLAFNKYSPQTTPSRYRFAANRR